MTSRRLLIDAVKHGRLDEIKEICQNDSVHITSTIFDLAAEYGHVDIMEYFNNKATYTIFAMEGAVANGHLNVVRWLYEHGAECSQSTADLAVKNNHLDVVQWLFYRGFYYNPAILDYASAEGHLEIVQWIVPNLLKGKYKGSTVESGWNVSIMIDNAVKYNHLRILQWLFEQYPNRALPNMFMKSIIKIAIENGSIDILQWLFELEGISTDDECTTYDANVMISAVRNGHINTVIWAHEKKIINVHTSFNSRLLDETVKKYNIDNLKITKYLWNLYKENEKLLNEKNDKLSVLDEPHCTLDAMQYVNLYVECMKLGRMRKYNQVELALDLMKTAVIYDRLVVAKWLHEICTDIVPSRYNIHDIVAAEELTDTVQWLRAIDKIDKESRCCAKCTRCAKRIMFHSSV